ncbi:hypothetical protein N1851_019441 [Merluccius polli]|uniref:Uncharacterized protein n=1 Tax=Merluccius polli TaxID=89951 RepID=A0AA47MM86_MERPO|nr:hypothetical protein N1851_019441 [Merluccius polli]
MELQSFTSRDLTELNPDIVRGLTEFERKLAEHFERVEIQGKRSRKVPVLLTPDMIAAMDLLMKSRKIYQVHKENVYIGSNCFRKYAKQCGAKNPEALTSTRLRKQVTTLSTLLNLKEKDRLATFLGHDICVHREFYRVPESILHLAKVSKQLIAIEKGRLPYLQGKGLDDIEVNPEGSRIETSRDQTLLRHTPESTTLDNMEGTSESTTLVNMEGTSESTTLDNLCNQYMVKYSHPKRPQSAPKKASCILFPFMKVVKVKSKWTGEVKAVERHMLHFITSCRVPGKKDCESCLQAEPVALNDRNWVAIKYYIHNRNIALKRR